MVRARRAAVFNTGNTGGGAGPPPTPGSLVVGPDYGERSGNDGTTWYLGVAADLADMAAAGDAGVGLALTLDDLAAAADLGIGVAVDLADMAAAADLGVGLAMTLDDMAAAAQLGLGVAVDLADMAAAANVGVGVAADLADMAASGGGQIGMALAASALFSGLLSDEDTWFDEANGTDTHGADTELLCRQDSLIGGQAQNAYVAWDLTGISTGSGLAGGTHQATFYASRVGGLVNANLNYEIYTNATKPFDESTASWDGDEPPPGTLLDTGQFPSLGTSLVSQTHSFAAGDIDTALGNWLYFRFIGETGLGNTQQFRVLSKEHGTASQRPDLTFELEA